MSFRRAFLCFIGAVLLFVLAACNNQQAEPLKETPKEETLTPLIAATTASDKPDYAPGDTVTLTGAGWQANESVHIFVNDDVGQTWSHDSNPDPVADATGAFTYQFQLPNWFVATYTVTATGALSGTATTSFTDASADLDQCANDPAPSPSTDGCNTNANEWVNGNLGASKSVYFEGDSVPYRMKFDGLTSPSYTVVIEWDTIQSDKHAIDYLTTFNRTVATANPCLGVTGCTFPGTPSTFAIPADPEVTGAGVTPVAGNFTLYGGTITGVSAYTYPNGTGFTGSQKMSRIAVTFTVPSPSANAKAVLAWGGHIATRSDWGLNNSAVAISGSPYHMRLKGFCPGAGTPATCTTGGNQDRSLSADAVIFPGSITIIKDATPNGATSFPFTASPAPLAAFSLVDDGTAANTKVFSGITNFTTYTINETPIPAGWGFDSVSCTVTSPNGGSSSSSTTTVSIVMKEGENYTCTYLNSQRNGTLTLVKTVTNDNGGTKTIADFPLSAAGPTPITGVSGTSAVTNASVNPGTYTLSETTVAGYTAGAWSCTGGTFTAPDKIKLDPGQSATCTINNNDQTAHLKLVKTVTNDNGGSAVATAWTLTADGTGSNDHSGAGGFDKDVNADTYTLSESTGPAGYTAGSFDCGAGAVTSVTLALGESKTCTINNNDDPNVFQTTLIVKKHVINDDGGTTGAGAFNLHVKSGGTDVSGSPAAGSETGVQYVLANGTYAISEDTPPSGYTQTGLSCVDGNGNPVTVNNGSVELNGGTVTCTITNDDQPAYVIVNKVVTNDNGGTAAPDDFKLTLDGVATTSGTQVKVNPGLHTAGETQLSGYSFEGYSGDCDSNGNVTVALGETKTCTLTNNDQPAYITVVKKVNNTHGGTAAPDDFKLTLEGNPVNSGVQVPVNPGTYTAGETLLPGYAFDGFSGDCDSNGDVTVALGESKTCTLTNSDQQAYVIVEKKVTNDNGGTAAPDDFKLTLDGNATTSGAQIPVNPGTYTAGETQLAGYTFEGFSGDCGSDGKVTVALGETKKCTLTNNDQAAYITVVKKVNNNNGGTAAPDDFKLTLDGNAISSGVQVAVNPGTYTAGEIQLAGYTFDGFSGDCGSDGKITVALGESKTCTLTNSDQPAYVIVNKVVTNDNGGTAAPDDFKLTLDGVATTSGTQVKVNPGLHTAGETQLSGYSFEGYSGDCDSNGNVTVALGETKTCTLTNNDQPAYVIVNKVVKNDNGGSAAPNDFKLTLDGTPTTSGTKVAVNPGEHTAAETQLSGYTFEGFSGDCGSDGKVTVALGETKTCTLTNNDQQAYIIVEKKVINDHGGTAAPNDFKLTLNGNAVSSGVQVAVNPGTYTAAETLLYGYTFDGFSGACGSDGKVTVALGETKTCTLTNNDQPGKIIVIKNAKPASGTFTFTTTGTGYGGFTLNVPTTGTISNTQTLAAGNYTVKESTQLGWILTGIGGSTDPNTPYNCVVTGSGGSTGVGNLNTQTATINLKNGDTVTCTFENTGKGVTRTQGFWSTHSPLAAIAWNGGTAFGNTFPGVANTPGILDQKLCGRTLGLNEIMGAFWSDVSKTTSGAKRSALDQARMQLLQQMIAAELNASAFGSVPSGGSSMFATWEAAYCGTNTTSIKNAQQQAASFNSNGDSGTFTPGTSADSKNARAIANKGFWDVLP